MELVECGDGLVSESVKGVVWGQLHFQMMGLQDFSLEMEKNFHGNTQRQQQNLLNILKRNTKNE